MCNIQKGDSAYARALHELIDIRCGGRVVYEPLDAELSLSVAADQAACMVDGVISTRR